MKKIKIETHEGTSDIVEVSEYDAVKIAAEINDSQDEHVIAFGDYIYSKINIKSIKPFEETEEEKSDE